METSQRRPLATRSDEGGFSLIETIFALGIMAFGLLTLASVFSYGMVNLRTGNSLLIAKEKAAEAIESVFMSRDTRVIGWSEVRNQAYGGIFLDGPQPMNVPGADGIVNTDDDGAVEQVVLPGADDLIGTADDEIIQLTNYTREITIVDVGLNLREIRVTIRYPYGGAYGEYTLMTYISSFA
jgi:type II secretory pathway pseudopilin PulG